MYMRINYFCTSIRPYIDVFGGKKGILKKRCRGKGGKYIGRSNLPEDDEYANRPGIGMPWGRVKNDFFSMLEESHK